MSRFSVGDQVRIRALETLGHSRVPAYARGRTGAVERVLPGFVIPEDEAWGRLDGPGRSSTGSACTRPKCGLDTGGPRRTAWSLRSSNTGSNRPRRPRHERSPSRRQLSHPRAGDYDEAPGEFEILKAAVRELAIARGLFSAADSATLHARQSRGFGQTAAARKLAELAARLERGRTRRDRAAVEAGIAKITRPRWLNRVLATTLAGDEPRQLRLTWTVDDQARRELETELFGKRILVTSRDDWPVPEVVAGYRSQSDAEAGFRQLKDPRVVSFSPMHHWTGQKIRVHVSDCVTALAIACLMRRQARAEGLGMSVRVLLSELAAIQETVLLYPSTGGRPRARRMLTDMTITQQRLYEIFGLDRYAPVR
jgi:hypothetical protein